jgi:hypothetical protein
VASLFKGKTPEITAMKIAKPLREGVGANHQAGSRHSDQAGKFPIPE